MKSGKSPRGRGSESPPKGEVLPFQGIVFTRRDHRRNGGVRGPRATGSIAHFRLLGKVLFGC